MMKNIIFPIRLLTVVIFVQAGATVQQNDWVAYKNQLYIKAFSRWDNYYGAKEFCTSQGDERSKASIIMVKEPDLQNLIKIYSQDFVDHIWLGGKYDKYWSQFRWEDGEPLTFANWQDGYPRNASEENACIELLSYDNKRPASAQGKWAHVSCEKRNLIMCQKIIPWTLEDAVREILENRRQLEIVRGQLDEEKKKREEVEAKLENVSSRVVPVGSIYIEYYGQPNPQTLWPTLGWLDITSTYGGLFFRAYGSGSENWGETQSWCAPRITRMKHQQRENGPQYPNPISIPPSGWSEYGYAGVNWKSGPLWYEGLQFYTENCEVRPRNQAIRIWKRVN